MERTSSIQADFNAVLATLEKLGQPSLKEMLIRNHGVHEPCWGVKLGDMKPLVRKFKHRQDLTRWLERARGGSLAGHSIPRLVALGPHAWVLGPRWIELKNARKRAAGWVVLGNNAYQCPEALAYLERSAQKGVIGKKRTL